MNSGKFRRRSGRTALSRFIYLAKELPEKGKYEKIFSLQETVIISISCLEIYR